MKLYRMVRNDGAYYIAPKPNQASVEIGFSGEPLLVSKEVGEKWLAGRINFQLMEE